MARHYVKDRAPTSPQELADVLSDPQRAAEMFGSDGRGWQEFQSAYIANANRSGALDNLINEAAQVEATRMLRDTAGDPQMPLAAAPAATGGRNKLYNKRAPGAQFDRVFAKSGPDALLGDFMRAAWHQGENTEYGAAIRNAQSERVPSQGGFLVPEHLRSSILQMVLERSIVRPRAMTVPMDSLRVPFPAIDETSHTSSVLGGIIGYWTEEAAALTASQPAFGRTVLEAHKLTIYSEVPNELLRDAVTLTTWMESQFPAALAFYEDVAFISGTGVGQPQGILNAPGALSITRTTSSKVQFADVVNMYARCLPQSHQSRSTVWLASPDVIPQLLQMAVTTGSTPTTVAPPVWLMEMNAANDVPTRLLGLPIIFSEKVPALGTTGDLMLVDWSFYLLGDRQEVTASSSEHYKFANDMTAFRWLERVDGRAWLQSPLTPENGSANTLSPYVLLHS